MMDGWSVRRERRLLYPGKTRPYSEYCRMVKVVVGQGSHSATISTFMNKKSDPAFGDRENVDSTVTCSSNQSIRRLILEGMESPGWHAAVSRSAD